MADIVTLMDHRARSQRQEKKPHLPDGEATVLLFDGVWHERIEKKKAAKRALRPVRRKAAAKH